MPVTAFIHEALPGRVLFGPASRREVPSELARLHARRVLVIAGTSQVRAAEDLIAKLGPAFAGLLDGVRVHVPESLARAAQTRAADVKADALVALGGGSAVGLAKAVALTTGAPILAVPTTYSGSEMTPIWGITARGHKTTGRDLRVLPRTVVYDPELTLSLPADTSAASAFNALAHCVEACWARGASPVVRAVAEEGARTLADALPRVAERPKDLDGRSGLLLGAHLAALALAGAGAGTHHRLAHKLGGAYDLPHAGVHAALLPYTAADRLARQPEAAERLARAISVPAGDVAGGLWDLARATGAPTSLAAVGLTAEQVADLRFEDADADAAQAREIIACALAGDRP
jgi:maleylacetate reductase